MKVIFAAWQVLPWLLMQRLALTAKIASRSTRASPSDICAGNVLPAELAAGPHSTIGKPQYDAILDHQKLQEVLMGNEHWAVGRHWELKLTATSDRTPQAAAALFAFAGAGDTGFFNFQVAPGAVNEAIEIESVIKSTANHTSFEYFGPQADAHHDVVLTNLCLRPKMCESFDGCVPATLWAKVTDDKPGETREECCVPKMCKDENPCTPETQWAQHETFDTLSGSTKDRCCTPKLCSATTAPNCSNDGKWKPKVGNGWKGTTKDECCDKRYCSEFSCPLSTAWGRKIDDHQLAQGNSKEECCTKISCSTFDCSASEVWVDKPDKANLDGRTYVECCDALYCEDFACPSDRSANKTELSPDKRKGGSVALCCDDLYCKDHVCGDEKLKKIQDPLRNRVGNSDAMCCEAKPCAEWQCSSSTKFVHRANIGDNNLVLTGFSDDECCDPIMCKDMAASVCVPASALKAHNASVMEGLKGSTPPECCEPIFCKDFNCSGDDDGDGDSTTWYKKVDTNHHLFRGSTDEECCIPKLCNQYNTQHPQFFKRKADNRILGSSDAECYDTRWCSDHCCNQVGKVMKPNASTIAGSTDEVCCLDKN